MAKFSSETVLYSMKKNTNNSTTDFFTKSATSFYKKLLIVTEQASKIQDRLINFILNKLHV